MATWSWALAAGTVPTGVPAPDSLLHLWAQLLVQEGCDPAHLDLSDEACILLAATTAALAQPPAWLLRALAATLPAPPKVRCTADRLRRWLLDHWHRPAVRQAAARALQAWTLPAFRQPGQVAAAAAACRDQGVNWVQVLWSAWCAGPGAVAVARDAWGTQDWDQRLAALLSQTRPTLCLLLVQPELGRALERLARAQEEEERTRILAERVRTLEWEAQAAQERHRRATEQLRQMGECLTRLEAELAAREQRIRELEAELAAQQQALAQWMGGAPGTPTAPSTAEKPQAAGPAHGPSPARGSSATRVSGPALPLAGQRVALVGGDPIAAGATAALEAMGAEVVFCPGYDQLNRVVPTVASADLVIAVTSYLSHKHVSALKSALPRSGARVLWVHTTGLSAFRRALEQQLKAG